MGKNLLIKNEGEKMAFTYIHTSTIGSISNFYINTQLLTLIDITH